MTEAQPIGQDANPVAEPSPITAWLSASVFVNAAAGAGNAPRFLPQIQRAFDAASVPAEFVFVERGKDLHAAAIGAIRGGRRLLIAVGGDGTLQTLVNAAYGADVVLGVLPAGGGNDFAAALGLPGNPVAAAEAILRGEPRTVDLARARTAEGKVRFYLGGGGIGIDAEAARYASGAFRRLPGRPRYVASALRALCGFRAIEARVEFPGSDLPPIEGETLLTAVLNTPTYGAGIKLAPEARMDDGWLDAVVVDDPSVFHILGVLPRLMKSGEVRSKHVRRFRVRSVRLTTERPCIFHGDGEMLGTTPVEIEVAPQAARFLAPIRE
ncbi:MAG: diacylglycerol/lipid kinase family protein [Candidatus Acidiferrum sp.]